ncbi:unnamed protein product [Rotaria sp. Silwood1]|nr:unnamed protein product [Rotaria sp. Silwood1]
MERRDDSTRRSSIHIYDTPDDNDIHDNDDDEETDDDYDDKYPVQYNSSHPISLQAAVATTFRKFIDKSLTVNHWQCEDDLSNISEDELIELLKPKFNKKEEIFHQPYHQANELIITTTSREFYELNRIEQQLEQQPSTTLPATTLSKTEKQRRKSMKLK